MFAIRLLALQLCCWLNLLTGGTALNILTFSTGSTQVRWPVVFAAKLANSSVPATFVWKFEGSHDQNCTVKGRIGSTCEGAVIEKAWESVGVWGVRVLAVSGGGTTLGEALLHVNITLSTAKRVAKRKEVKNLSDNEWKTLVDTLYFLKDLGVYDHFVHTHLVASAKVSVRTGFRNPAHRGPAFLPWHRVFLILLEQALQVAAGVPTLGVPYWDWTDDSPVLWTEKRFGPRVSNNSWVESGPFCSKRTAICVGRWPVLPELGGPFLARASGQEQIVLPNAKEVAEVLQISNYDTWPYNSVSKGSFRNAIEGWGDHNGRVHNQVHNWVGGSMVPLTSPNDPLFFFHHAFVDKLWLTWQITKKCYASCYRPQYNDLTVNIFTPGAVLQQGKWKLLGQQWGDRVYPWLVGAADVAAVNNSVQGYTYE